METGGMMQESLQAEFLRVSFHYAVGAIPVRIIIFPLVTDVADARYEVRPEFCYLEMAGL